MGFLEFSDANLIALTRQRRRERAARREIERAHNGASKGKMLSVAKRKDATLYFGGERSVIKFAPTPDERAIRRNQQQVAKRKRKAVAAERANKYARVFALQGGRCYLCGYEFESQDEATDDHVTPKAHGGKRLGNILHACRPCNNAKSHRAPYPCELIYLEAVLRHLPAYDLKRAGGKPLALPVFIPLRRRLAAQAAE